MSRALAAALLLMISGCGLDEVVGGPLNREECGQLMDKIHDVVGEGLTGEDLAEYDADRDREADIEDCVTDPAWDRAGFNCAMKATGEPGLKACILMD